MEKKIQKVVVRRRVQIPPGVWKKVISMYLKNSKIGKLVVTMILLITLLTTGCASLMPHPRPWTKQEKLAAGFFIAAHAANALTTEAHQDHPELYYEKNPILGKHPSDAEIGTYFSITGVGTLLIAHFYPELRQPLLISYGAANCYWTMHDYKIMH
jgi:uncharacterized protein YceK